MKPINLLSSVIVLFLILHSSVSFGQELPQPPTELALFEEISIVYTPAKKEQLITEAPASTYIITAEDIRLYGSLNIYDALRQVSGVNVMATTVSQPDISIRGLNELVSNTTLLLVDGRNIYIPLQGVFFWETIPIQLEEIKQIEVVKGPVASLYGANAFNGLINIITKSPEEINGTVLQGKLGTEDTYTGALVHGQKVKNLGYKVSLGWRKFNYSDNDEQETNLGKINTELEYDLSDISSLSLSAGLVDGKFPFIGDSIPGYLGDMSLDASYIKLKYILGGLESRFFWNHMDSEYTPSVFDIDGKINDYEFELKYNFSVWEKHSVTAGGGARYDTARSNIYIGGRSEKDATLWNIYLQDDFEVTDKLRLVGSGRLDHHSIADYNMSGRLAGIFSLSDSHILRASVGNSFRAPTFTEYFMDVTHKTPFLTTKSRGNEELDVETIVTTEFGYHGYFFDKKIAPYADIFWSRLKDFIDNVITGFTSQSPLVAEAQYTNQGSADTWGIEPGIEIALLPWLSCFANYSYQDVNFSDGAYTRLTPKHKINLGVMARIKEKFIATVYSHYVSSAKEKDTDITTVSDYTLLNARLGYEFNKNIELALAGFNLLDDKHKEAPGGEEIGMRVTGELTVRF